VVSEPEVVFVVALVVAEPEEVFALVFSAAEPGVVFVVDLEVSEPGVVLAAVVLAAVFLAAVVSTAHVSGPQASVDIRVASDVSVPVSGVAAEVDSPGPPRFLAFPNVDHYASSPSSGKVVSEESVHSSTGVRANDGLCSILSNLGLHQNKNLELCHNNPNPGYDDTSDTNDPPIDATTSHDRKRCPRLSQGQRRHTYQVSRLPRAVREMEWVAAEESQCVYLQLPLLE